MQGAVIRRAIVVGTMVLGLMLAVQSAEAQTGQVKGKVTDAKGQPVEGAVVTIEATDGMGRSFKLKTNRRGEYIQIGLQPGQYKITAPKDNLSDSRQQRISLDAAEVNLTLTPGGGGGDASAEERKKAEARVAAVKATSKRACRRAMPGTTTRRSPSSTRSWPRRPSASSATPTSPRSTCGRRNTTRPKAVYKKAIEINPSSFEAYSGLANLYNAQKKFDQAAEASAQAQKLGAAAPGGASASSVFNQGVIAWNASKIADAKKAFEEAVKLDPKLADAHYWLGMANLNEGKMPDAAKSFEEYLKLAPTGQYAEQAKGILTQIKK